MKDLMAVSFLFSRSHIEHHDLIVFFISFLPMINV